MICLFVTVKTREIKRKTLLEESCERFGVPLLCTQTREPWVGFKHNKIDRLFLAVKDLTWDYLLYCDANDAFITSPRVLEESVDFIRTWKNLGILYSGETNCWPWPERHKPLYQTLIDNNILPFGGKYPFANAGVWIAERGAYLEAAEWMTYWNDGYEEQERSVSRGNCDQLHANELVIRGKAKVDSKDEWCQNLYGLTYPEMRQEVFGREEGAGFFKRKLPPPLIVHGSSWENKPLVNDLWREFIK